MSAPVAIEIADGGVRSCAGRVGAVSDVRQKKVLFLRRLETSIPERHRPGGIRLRAASNVKD